MRKAKKNILFVCTANRLRSATAEQIFKEDHRFKAQSAGTDQEAPNTLTQELLDWADAILVMEKHHRNYIRKKFPEVYRNKKVVCLYIPDEFEYMEAGLIRLLKEKVENILLKGLI